MELINNITSILASLVTLITSAFQCSKRNINKGEIVIDYPHIMRFIQLFEKHNINKNQIPRFFGHGLTLDDLSTPEKLLPKLTHELLQAASDLFAIRLEWLEGADDVIYPTHCHQFYNDPERFAQFITDLKQKNDSHGISAHFIISNCTQTPDYNAILVIKEVIGELGDTQIFRYHLCSQQWTHQYWKARADLAACVAIACAELGNAWGFQTKENISNFDRGEHFLSELDKLPQQKINTKNPNNRMGWWRPEDWVADPDSFLDGVDEGKFGKVNALSRWLEYAQTGLMNTRFPIYADTNQRFTEALAKLQH